MPWGRCDGIELQTNTNVSCRWEHICGSVWDGLEGFDDKDEG